MSDVRVGFGLVALRKRYVYRAEVLTGDEHFARACAEARRDWNATHERYSLATRLNCHGMPQALAEDYLPAMEAFEASERANYPDDPEASAKDLYEDDNDRRERRASEMTLRAYDDWQDGVWQLVDVFFPTVDFPTLSDDEAHPAAVFLGNAINGPRVKGLRYRADGMIAKMRLDVTDATFGNDDPLLALGLYPGVTPQDVRAAAVKIAEVANGLYRDRLPLVRIETLRAEGLTHEAIGDRLGMTARAVKDALAG